MPITLPFAEYQFTYRAIDRINMPRLNGTLWHSVLGNAMYEICQQEKTSDYEQLFCGIPLELKKTPTTSKASNIPPPHLFRSDIDCYQISPQQSFNIKLILIGSANQKLALFINAMKLAANNGFNKERNKAQLVQVTQKTPYGVERGILIENSQQQSGLALLQPILQPLKKVRIQLKTPFRHTGKAAKSKKFLLDHFLMNIIRRISLFQYHYTQEKPVDNFIELKQQTLSIPILRQQVIKTTIKSLKYRHNQHQQNTGWTGYIDIETRKHHELWSYLYLGQWFNTGKNASMGFGQYQLIDLA